MLKGKLCTPRCEFFRCRQKALKWRSDTAWCMVSGDPCIGYKCNYASCERRKMLNDGRCGLTIKSESSLSLEEIERETMPKVSVRVKGKLTKKLKFEDLV
ncbi:MAG: hypothetical protein QXQ29_00440 [Candidatus Bathyarchaeia archaeon]